MGGEKILGRKGSPQILFALDALLQEVLQVVVVQENCWWLRFDGAADLMASLLSPCTRTTYTGRAHW